jgi:hypothetical protein
VLLLVLNTDVIVMLAQKIILLMYGIWMLLLLKIIPKPESLSLQLKIQLILFKGKEKMSLSRLVSTRLPPTIPVSLKPQEASKTFVKTKDNVPNTVLPMDIALMENVNVNPDSEVRTVAFNVMLLNSFFNKIQLLFV